MERNKLSAEDKRIAIFILVFWAHFRRKAPETGLSACIFLPAAKRIPLLSLARSI
jgi:hypothetical protein